MVWPVKVGLGFGSWAGLVEKIGKEAANQGSKQGRARAVAHRQRGRGMGLGPFESGEGNVGRANSAHKAIGNENL